MKKKIKYILYRLLWHIAPLLPKGKFIHLDLEVNNTCNQRCIFCWHSKKDTGFKLKFMSTARVFNFLEQAREAGAMSVKFNLRGEPLLNNSLAKYIKHARKLGFIDIMINTNGVLLNSRKIIELSRAGLTSCVISVDSLDKKTYRKLHGCSDLFANLLFENIQTIRKLKKAKEIDFRVELNFHVNKINDKEDFNKYKKDLAPLKVNIKKTVNRKGRHIALPTKNKVRKKSCPHMKRRLTVLVDGKVYPCCVSYNEPDDIKLDSKSKSLKEIWDGQGRLLSLYLYKNGHYKKTCINCTSNDIYK